MPAPKRYPDGLRERDVRMVFQVREKSEQQLRAVARVPDQLGVNRETLCNWIREAEIDTGRRAGTWTADPQRIAELERDLRELRRATVIIKAAPPLVQELASHPRPSNLVFEFLHPRPLHRGERRQESIPAVRERRRAETSAP
jgi:transposase